MRENTLIVIVIYTYLHNEGWLVQAADIRRQDKKTVFYKRISITLKCSGYTLYNYNWFILQIVVERTCDNVIITFYYYT